MKIILLTLSILVSFGCTRSVSHESKRTDKNLIITEETNVDSEKSSISEHGNSENLENLLGSWVMSNSWGGYMGVAIQFRKDDFRYWCYSDVRLDDEPSYPIIGKYELKDNVITLHSNASLYDTTWILTAADGKMHLCPNSEIIQLSTNQTMDESRYLFKDTEFDDSKPFNYQFRR